MSDMMRWTVVATDIPTPDRPGWMIARWWAPTEAAEADAEAARLNAEEMDLMRRAQAAQDAVLAEAEAEGIPLAVGGAYRLAYVALAADDNHRGAVEERGARRRGTHIAASSGAADRSDRLLRRALRAFLDPPGGQ